MCISCFVHGDYKTANEFPFFLLQVLPLSKCRIKSRNNLQPGFIHMFDYKYLRNTISARTVKLIGNKDGQSEIKYLKRLHYISINFSLRSLGEKSTFHRGTSLLATVL